MKNLLYYFMTLVDVSLESKIVEFLKEKKTVTVFDVGCYKGSFTKKILQLIKKKKLNFIYLMLTKTLVNIYQVC